MLSENNPTHRNMWPRITLVTPCRNGAEFLEETIRSVVAQEYPNLEYIVVDGGSTDDTVSILRKYDEWIDRWRSESDGGQADAIMKGFSWGSGEILGWLNADDRLEPNALYAVANAFLETGADVIVGQCVIGDPSLGAKCGPLERPSLKSLLSIRSNWCRGSMIVQPECFFRRSAYEEVGRLDAKLQLAFDYDFWVRLVESGRTFAAIHRHIATLRRHPGQKTYDFRPATLEMAGAARRHLERNWAALGDDAEVIAAEINAAIADVGISYRAEQSLRDSGPKHHSSVPTFSLIILAQRDEALLAHCIASAKTEFANNAEIVIVRNYANASPVRSLNAAGLASARQYIIFATDDDIWFPGAHSILARAVHEMNRPAMIAGTRRETHSMERPPPLSEIEPSFRAHVFPRIGAAFHLADEFAPSAFAIRSDVFKTANGFDEGESSALIANLILRCANATALARIEDPPIAWRRLQASQSLIAPSLVSPRRLIFGELLGRHRSALAPRRARWRAISSRLRHVAWIAGSQREWKRAVASGLWALAFGVAAPRSTTLWLLQVAARALKWFSKQLAVPKSARPHLSAREG